MKKNDKRIKIFGTITIIAILFTGFLIFCSLCSVSLKPEKLSTSIINVIPGDTVKPALRPQEKNKIIKLPDQFDSKEKFVNYTPTTPEELSGLQPLPNNPFEEIDRYVQNAPSWANNSMEELVKYLGSIAKTDLEKARAIYVWLAENIYYDDYGYNTGNYGDNSAKGVFNSGKGVCGGFAYLFTELGEKMGLDIQYVRGYTSDSKTVNHAWNIIKIEDEWRVFDATWGQGYANTVNGKIQSVKEFEEFWFNLSPYASIFSHFPENETLQNVSPQISLTEFYELPDVNRCFFELGFNPEQIFRQSLSNKNLKLPSAYPVGTYVKVNTAPKQNELYSNVYYSFDFFAPRVLKAAALDSDGKWTFFTNETGKFKLRLKPENIGNLKILFMHENSDGLYYTALEYFVPGPKTFNQLGKN